MPDLPDITDEHIRESLRRADEEYSSLSPEERFDLWRSTVSHELAVAASGLAHDWFELGNVDEALRFMRIARDLGDPTAASQILLFEEARAARGNTYYRTQPASSEPIDKAYQRVLDAAARLQRSHDEEQPTASSDWEREYAGEQLALASRELVAVVNGLPEHDRPIGWDTAVAPDPGGALTSETGYVSSATG